MKEKTQTSVRIGCMDGVTASLDTTFVLEVNFFAIQKLLSFFFRLVQLLDLFCSVFSDLIFQVFHVVNGTQELIASNWSRSAEVQTLESKKLFSNFMSR